MRLGSVFSGIGGLDLGLERALSCELAWACEADPFCRRVLAVRWPAATIYDDVRTLTDPPVCNVLCGGFPCQDVSLAGKGAGLAGARSGLWFEMLRVVGLVRPSVVVIENVGALVKRGLATVVEGLAGLGYDVEWTTLSAMAVGALHIRSRVFVVAHRLGRVGVFAPPAVVESAFRAHRGGLWSKEPAGVPRTVSRADMRPAVRRARLKALGNAVVPQVAEVVGACVARALRDRPEPRGWRCVGTVLGGEPVTVDLFGDANAVEVPACGAFVAGGLYATRSLCDARTARTRHDAMPGPFHPVPTPQGYARGKEANSEPGLTPLDLAVRGLYGRGVVPTPTAADGERMSPTYQRGNQTLLGAALRTTAPTPTASDADAAGSRCTPGSAASPGLSLTDFVREDGGRGRTSVPSPIARLGDPRRGAPSAAVGARRLDSGRSNLDDAVARGRIAGSVPTPRNATGRSMDATHMDIEGAIASGLLPTPTATPYGSSQGGVNAGRPSGHRPSLERIARGAVPTPRASDWRSGLTSDATAERNAQPLCEVVARLTTSSVTPHHKRRILARPRRWLAGGRVRRALQATSSHLNPGWVSWLMGFPVGWFDA